MAVLSGYSLPYNNLHTIFKILYWMNPVQYYFTGVAGNELYCNEIKCPYIFVVNLLKFLPINQYISDIKGIIYSRRWYSLLYLLMCCLFWRLPFILCMKLIRYECK